MRRGRKKKSREIVSDLHFLKGSSQENHRAAEKLAHADVAAGRAAPVNSQLVFDSEGPSLSLQQFSSQRSNFRLHKGTFSDKCHITGQQL